MEMGLPAEKRLALYLVMDYSDENQRDVINTLQKIVDGEELERDQLSRLLVYIRQINMDNRYR